MYAGTAIRPFRSLAFGVSCSAPPESAGWYGAGEPESVPPEQVDEKSHEMEMSLAGGGNGGGGDGGGGSGAIVGGNGGGDDGGGRYGPRLRGANQQAPQPPPAERATVLAPMHAASISVKPSPDVDTADVVCDALPSA